MPGTDALRPSRQRAVRIAAAVQLLVAMQPQVHEIRGDVLRHRPLPGRLCDDQRDALLAQQIDEGGVAKALVPDFDGVTQRTLRVDCEAHPAFHPRRPPPRQPAGRFGVARQHAEEALHALPVVFEVRRELPEDRPEFLAQVEHTRCEEIGERLLDPAQPQHVSDVAASLDAEYETLRRLRAPLRVALGPLQRVERPIDLDRGETARGVLELGALRQIRRIERPPPGCIAPAGDADADCGHERPGARFAPGRRRGSHIPTLAIRHEDEEVAMKYVLLIYQGPTPPLPGTDRWKALPEAEQKAIYADYAELGKTPGVTPGLPLGVPGAARTVQVRNERPEVRNGTYLSEGAGGYLVLEAESMDAAVALAARIPAARLGGAIEVRPAEQYW